MINVLFVAWEFPPLTAGGVQRPLYFVKYLQKFDINPIVITVKDYKHYGKQDETLLKEIPKEAIIERIECDILNEASKNKITQWANIYFSLVEKHGAWWKPHLENTIKNIIQKYQPKAIFVTIPPFSMAPLWVEISEKYKLPLVLDFRDAWSQWIISPYGSWLHYQALLRLEKKCITKSHKIICTSQQIADDLKRLHPLINDNKLHVITNGFDRDIEQWITNSQTKNKFVIGYVGSFYYSPLGRDEMFKPWWEKKIHRMLQYTPRKEDWLYRSPYFFLKAVAVFLKDNPLYKNHFIIKFAGHKPNWIDTQISEFGLQSNCEFVGFLNHDEVINFQQSCDALLLTSSKVVGGRDYSIAGKTYEYFTIAKPILAFVCEGAQKDILKPSGITVICDPDNTYMSARQIKELVENNTFLRPNYDYLNSFKREKLTKQLANIFKSL